MSITVDLQHYSFKGIIHRTGIYGSQIMWQASTMLGIMEREVNNNKNHSN